MSEIIIPVSICAVMPITIVLIIFLAKMYANKKNAQILIKAIESGNNIDIDKLTEALGKPQKTAQEMLNLRLQRGCLYSIIGVFLVGWSIVALCNGSEIMDDPVCIPGIVGLISLALGISYLAVYFVSRKNIDNPQNEKE